MNASSQRQAVLIGSLSLTMLLLGGVVGGVAMWRSSQERMQDPEFLRKQLDQLSPESGKTETGPPPALVRVGVARRKAIHPERPIVGRLVEVRKVTVASEVTGKILEMPVEEGTPVTANETEKTLLARVDDVWCQLALERCEAQKDSTEAKLKYERAELKRSTKLNRSGESTGTISDSELKLISDSELELKQATVDELEASLLVCEAAAKEAAERASRSEIRAPFDGTVIAKHAELGGHVSPGDPIVDIVSRGEVDANLMVPESVVNLIGVDQELAIRIDPLGEEVRGTVVSVTPYGPTASRTFPVRVRLDDQGGRLKVGMSVTASIAIGPEREALVVSRDAVLVRPDGSTVWVALTEGQGQTAEVHPVPVTIAARMREEYAVEPETEAGRKLLVPGARVVVEGAERLMPTQQVRIITLDGGRADVAGSGELQRPTRPDNPAKAAPGAAGD